MKRDKDFIKNSIKMDLHRVVTASGDIRKEIPKESVKIFLDHARKDFEKMSLTKRETSIKNKFEELIKKFDTISDPHERLRWTEDILTIRCRL